MNFLEDKMAKTPIFRGFYLFTVHRLKDKITK